MFEKRTEKLAYEQRVAVEDIAALYVKCGAPKEDPELFDSYPIKKEDALFFAALLPRSFTFDFECFDYFLESSS